MKSAFFGLFAKSTGRIKAGDRLLGMYCQSSPPYSVSSRRQKSLLTAMRAEHCCADCGPVHGGALPVADEFPRVGRTVLGQHEGNARFFVNLLCQNPRVVHAVGVDDVGGAVVAHIVFK